MKTAVTNQTSAGSSGSQSQGSDSGGEDSSKENKETSSNNGDAPGTPRRKGKTSRLTPLLVRWDVGISFVFLCIYLCYEYRI